MSEQLLKYRLAALPSGKADPARLEHETNASDSPINTQLKSIEVDGMNLCVTFKSALSAPERTAWDNDATPGGDGFIASLPGDGGMLGGHSGEPMPDENVSPLGNPVVSTEHSQKDAARVAIVGTAGKSVIYGTINWCKKSSWYSASKRITCATAGVDPSLLIEPIANTDNKDFQLPVKHIINIFGGQVFDDLGLIQDQNIFEPTDQHGYQFICTVDGTEYVAVSFYPDEQAEQRAIEPSGTKFFTINYDTGRLHFEEDMEGKLIEVKCSHADGDHFESEDLVSSAFVLRPLPDKSLVISEGEVQFSKDIEYNRNIVMETYGEVQFFAPHLMEEPYNLPATHKIPLPDTRTVYRSMHQFALEARNALAGSHVEATSTKTFPRGMQSDLQIFPLHYDPVKKLFGCLGMEARVFLAGYKETPSHKAFKGEHASATFYMKSQTVTDPVAAFAELLEE